MHLLTRAILTGLAGLVAVAAFAGDDPAKMTPIQTMQGGDSKLDLVLVRLIQSGTQWKELWAMHKGGPVKNATAQSTAPSPPAVDFGKNEVLAVFGGHLPDVDSYQYVKTFANGNTAVIQLTPNTIPPTKRTTVQHPFILLVLPKEAVKLQIQMDITAKDGSHNWATIASFPVPKV